MKKMGLYCKAYHLGSLRAYPAWSEKAENARKTDADGDDLSHPRVLSDDSIVYLQEIIYSMKKTYFLTRLHLNG